MNVQQGFNRIATSVAGAFLVLAAVCLFVAGLNYIEYRSEIATEYASRFGGDPDRIRQERFMLPHEKRKNWETFKTDRFRSVDRSLYLSVICLIAALVSAIFWWSIGWLSVFWHARRAASR